MSFKIGMYIGSWPQNIGNAFFDFGAIAIIKAAYPNATLYPMGGAVHWMFNQVKDKPQGVLKKLYTNISNADRKGNSIEIGQFAKVDLIVFAGMSMCDEFIANNGKTFVDASKRGVAILVLGAGALQYTNEEAERYAEFLSSLGRYGVLTRDEDTYNLFRDRIQNIQSGIDCAFFLPDYYQPPMLDLPLYDVLTFDSMSVPVELHNRDNMVIHAHHDCWGPLPDHYTNKPNTLVSDVPQDYLTIYSQANETHSDRVHACIATLAYGKRAKLYSNTPRKALFKKVGMNNVCDETCSVDLEMLEKLKSDQINLTRALIKNIVPGMA